MDFWEILYGKGGLINDYYDCQTARQLRQRDRQSIVGNAWYPVSIHR